MKTSNPLDVEILSGDIVGELFLKYGFKLKTERDDRVRNDDLKGKGDDAIHDDLKRSFRQLVPHFILICEQEDPIKHEELFASLVDDFDNVIFFPGDNLYKAEAAGADDKPNALIAAYNVTGFKMDSTGENEAVILQGTRILKGGGKLTITSPPLKFNNSPYKFLHELRASVDNCKEEVLEYINGKCAPPVQGDLFEADGEQEGTSVEITAGGKTIKMGSLKDFNSSLKGIGKKLAKDKTSGKPEKEPRVSKAEQKKREKMFDEAEKL